MLRFQYKGRSGRAIGIGMRNGRFDDEHSGHFVEGLCRLGYIGGRRDIPVIFKTKLCVRLHISFDSSIAVFIILWVLFQIGCLFYVFWYNCKVGDRCKNKLRSSRRTFPLSFIWHEMTNKLPANLTDKIDIHKDLMNNCTRYQPLIKN